MFVISELFLKVGLQNLYSCVDLINHCHHFCVRFSVAIFQALTQEEDIPIHKSA